MSRDSVLGSFFRGLRDRLASGNRKARRAGTAVRGLDAADEHLLGFDALEQRTVPATYFWTGWGNPTLVVNDAEVRSPPALWSNPNNWLFGQIPSGSNADIIFDERWVNDFDTAPGTGPGDFTDSDPTAYGSFQPVNDLPTSTLSGIRSITIQSLTGTGPSVWQFNITQTAPATLLTVEVQAGIRTFGTTRGDAQLGQNILGLALQNRNGVTGFNVNVAPGSPLRMTRQIDLFDPVQQVGGLLNCTVGATGYGALPPIYLEPELQFNGAIVGLGASDGSRVSFQPNSPTSRGRVAIFTANTYNGLTTIDNVELHLFNNDGLGQIIGFNNPTGGTLVKPGGSLKIRQGITVPVGEDVTLSSSPGLVAEIAGSNNAVMNGDIFLLSPNCRIAAYDFPAFLERAQFFVNGRISDANFIPANVTEFYTGADPDSYVVLANPNNNYTGVTRVTGTRLLKLAPANGVGDILPNTGVIPDSSPVQLVGSASLDVNNYYETIGSLEGDVDSLVTLGIGRLTFGGNNLDRTFNGRISSAINVSDLQGGITKIGTGVQTLTNRNLYTGQTLINQGTLRIGDLQNGADLNPNVIDDLNRVTVGNLATLDLANHNETIGSVVGLGGSARINLGSGTLTTGGNDLSTDFDGIIIGSGGLTKRGVGTFGLLGANTYTGPTAIKGGILQIKNLSERLSDLTAVTVDPGTIFDLNNFNETISSLSGGILLPGTDPSQYGRVTLGSGNLVTNTAADVGNQPTIFAGRISGTGSVTKGGSGTWALLNTNSFSGAFQVLAGIIIMGDSSSGVLASSVPNVSTTVTIATGARMTGDGRVLGNVTINNGATLTPTSPLVPEPLDIDGNLTMLSGSTYIMSIGDQFLYGRMTVSGSITLGTTVTLQTPISASYVPVNGARFSMIIKGGVTPITSGIFSLPGSPARPLTDGSYININGNLFRITYSTEANNTAGNDVILTGLVNNAPIYDNTPPNPQLTAILEDQDPNFNFGNSVASILGSRVSDPDIFAVKGMAVIGFGGASGTWQYRLSAGGGTFGAWTNFNNTTQATAFLLRDVDQVRFLPAANANGIATILFRAWDQTFGLPGTTADLSTAGSVGGQTAFSSVIGTGEISVVAVNDAPINIIPTGALQAFEETPKVLAGFGVSDIDAGTGKLTVSLTVGHGILTINTGVAGGLTTFDVTGNGTPTVVLVGTVTQINNTLANATGLTYLGNNLFSGIDTLTMSTSDNGNTGIGGALTDVDTVNITVTHINHSPVLNGATSPALTPINEDNVNSAGNAASFANAFITDVDVNDLKGIAIIGVAGTVAGDTGPLSGVWQFSTNGGTTWSDFPAVSPSTALVLRDTDKIRFVPGQDKNGTVSITYKAWDRSDGATPGTTINATGGGGNSSVSTADQTATLPVLPINDAPVGTLPTGTLVSPPGTLSQISPISANDVETDYAGANVKVTLTALHGTITIRTGIASGLTSAQIVGNGSSTVVITAPSVTINKTFGSVNGVRYITTGGFVGLDTLTMVISDQGLAGAGGVQTTTMTLPIRSFEVTDVVGRDQATGQWWVGKNTGGGFANQYFGSWAPTVNWLDIVVGDFNRDGYVRDIAGRDAATGNWWLAVSNGVGFTNVYFGTWAPGVAWTNVLVGDFNRDGFMDDIAGRDPSTGAWWVAKGNGTGFTNVAFGSWTNSITWVDVKVGNFSNSRYGDGTNIPCDIIGRASQSGQWWGALSLNGTSFSNRLYGAWAATVTWVDVNVLDIDADGYSDDIVGRLKSNGQWWALKTNGISGINQLLGSWASTVSWADVRVGDFDNDGFVNDIAGRNPGTGQWQVSQANGTTFVDTRVWATWTSGFNWVDVVVGDFNGDGFKGDIAGRDKTTGYWRVLIANGTTTFGNTLYGQWTASLNWVDVRAADFG